MNTVKKFRYYPFAVKLDKCVGSCNTLKDLSNKVCVPDNTEDLNLNVFNMITRINVSKTLTKYILCVCKCRCDERKRISDQRWNNDKVNVNVKNFMHVKKITFEILLHKIV